jgi:Ca2+-binding EF-hand superfamily protein
MFRRSSQRHFPVAAGRVLILTILLSMSCNRAASNSSATPFLVEPTGSIFEQMDVNGDGKLGFEAFHEGLSFHYYFRQGLDLDGDGIMQPTELTTAFFEMWDVDDDGTLSPNEWRAGLAVWFPDRIPLLRFETWDLDRDGTLSVIELGEGALRSRIYDAYDANRNAIIETREASVYLFAQWDTNHDGFVELEEWPL